VSPEHLTVEHVDRRSEHIGCDRSIPTFCFPARPDLIGAGAHDQRLQRRVATCPAIDGCPNPSDKSNG